MTYKIVVLISGFGSNLQALIDNPDVPKLTAVISNKADAYGLKRAKKADIPCHVINHQDFNSRAEFDAALKNLIDSYQADLIVLAGFMRVLTAEFVDHYAGRLLNIHPSLLPKFKGLHTHQRALDAGEQEHGSSVHFVTADLDGGPLIAQGKITIEQNDDAKSLADKVLQVEHRIYPQVISWFVKDRLRLVANKALLDGKEITNPLI